MPVKYEACGGAVQGKADFLWNDRRPREIIVTLPQDVFDYIQLTFRGPFTVVVRTERTVTERKILGEMTWDGK